MEVLRVRYTRPDEMTTPGGIIIRKYDTGVRIEYKVHNFCRERGSKIPVEYFWGRYIFDDERRAIEAFNEKVTTASHYGRGGSLIPEDQLEEELKKELADVTG